MAEQAEVVAVEVVDINDVANETSSCREDMSIGQLAIRTTKLFAVALS